MTLRGGFPNPIHVMGRGAAMELSWIVYHKPSWLGDQTIITAPSAKWLMSSLDITWATSKGRRVLKYGWFWGILQFLPNRSKWFLQETYINLFNRDSDYAPLPYFRMQYQRMENDLLLCHFGENNKGIKIPRRDISNLHLLVANP